MEVEISKGDQKKHFAVEGNALRSDEEQIPFEILQKDAKVTTIRLGSRVYQVYDIQVADGQVAFSVDGKHFQLDYKDDQALLLEKMGFKSASKNRQGQLKAPMPGKILEILVTEGDSVELGTPLLILEAMKMENELKSPVSGTVQSVHATTGTSVEKNTLLIEIA